MNALLQYKLQPWFQLISGIFFVVISILWYDFPLFIFVAFAPLFALLDFSWARKTLYTVALVSFVGLLSELLLLGADLNTPVLLYIFLITGLFAFYAIVQQFTSNKLTKFALLILITAMEYLLLKVMIQSDPVFLADILNQRSEWTRWNNSTGYLGVSFWIMGANLIFYQALFKTNKVNVLLFVLGVLCVVLPILYSLNLDYNAVTKEDVINLYKGNPLKVYNTYTRQGELISRSGAWVSILIIIFTLVRVKTKKVAR